MATNSQRVTAPILPPLPPTKMANTTPYSAPESMGTSNPLQMAVGVGKGIASAPVRVGASIADLPNQLRGKEPMQPFNVPFLGQQQTYARQFLDQRPKIGAPAAFLQSASQGILDVAGTGQMAQQAVNYGTYLNAYKGASNVGQATLKNPMAAIESSADIKQYGGMAKLTPEGYYPPTMGTSRISDMAGKLNQAYQGLNLGDRLFSVLDPAKTTPEMLKNTALSLVRKYAGWSL